MRDFTLKKYTKLIEAAVVSEFLPTSYEKFIENTVKQKTLILRQDVDKSPENSLKLAQLQHEMGIISTFYFRMVPASYNEKIIKKIISLGHEIGYHYEDMAICRGDEKKAIGHFETSLNKLRTLYPVKTICMHGSPLSKWDNRSLWKNYNYKDFGIIGEPYLDLDFNKVLYITDTGRKWNNNKVSVRDKVNSTFSFDFQSTDDIIQSFNSKELPPVVMLNIHPQRWTNDIMKWGKELILQNTKNKIKAAFFVKGTP